MPANAFKTLFLLLSLFATCTQLPLNEKNVSIYTPSSFSCEQWEVLRQTSRVGIVLHWVRGEQVTVDFGADINNELSRRKQAISVR